MLHVAEITVSHRRAAIFGFLIFAMVCATKKIMLDSETVKKAHASEAQCVSVGNDFMLRNRGTLEGAAVL